MDFAITAYDLKSTQSADI